jgi:hypothetical protein
VDGKVIDAGVENGKTVIFACRSGRVEASGENTFLIVWLVR